MKKSESSSSCSSFSSWSTFSSSSPPPSPPPPTPTHDVTPMGFSDHMLLYEHLNPNRLQNQDAPMGIFEQLAQYDRERKRKEKQVKIPMCPAVIAYYKSIPERVEKAMKEMEEAKALKKKNEEAPPPSPMDGNNQVSAADLDSVPADDSADDTTETP